MLALYEEARNYMRENGNPTQWGTTHPPETLLQEDLAMKRSYLCVTENNEILGVFAFWIGEDPMYAEIEGAWPYQGEYGVIHRIATKRTTHGIGRFCLEWACQQCEHFRIDTHENNLPMLHLLQNMGFTRCGTVYTPEPDHAPRIAWSKQTAS